MPLFIEQLKNCSPSDAKRVLNARASQLEKLQEIARRDIVNAQMELDAIAWAIHSIDQLPPA